MCLMKVPIAIIAIKRRQRSQRQRNRERYLSRPGNCFCAKTGRAAHDLGLSTWPATASGKVRKVELRVIVKEYVNKQEQAAIDTSASTVDSLIQIWQTKSGVNGLKPETSIRSFADSLMMMLQLSGTVKKQLSRDVTVEDSKLCETINEQADLIDSKPDVAALAAIAKSARQTTPMLDELTYLRGDALAYEDHEAAVTAS